MCVPTDFEINKYKIDKSKNRMFYLTSFEAKRWCHVMTVRIVRIGIFIPGVFIGNILQTRVSAQKSGRKTFNKIKSK